MKLPDITNPPPGVGILTFFYLLSAIIFAFAMTLFYEYIDVLIFGIVIPGVASLIIKIVFVLLPLYIYFGFTRFRRNAWVAALAYHIFFVLNSILCIINLINKGAFIKPFFQIVAKSPPDFFKSLYLQESIANQLSFLTIGVILGTGIIVYLVGKNDYFMY